MTKLFSYKTLFVLFLLLGLSGLIMIYFGTCQFIKSRSLSVVKLQTIALEPNFHIGQKFIVKKPKDGIYKRGDLVVYMRGDEGYIHRIIGLPEETVEIIDGDVLINGIELQLDIKFKKYFYTTEKVKLGKDEYYLLGDNRMASIDSHNVGPIRYNTIRGIAEPIP
jgi:signal peptidase I